MANWTILKTAIADVVRANGNQEITGPLLQNALNSIVNVVGEHATFAGVATPSTNPGVPDGPVFYLATTPGIYSNFNGIVVNYGDVAILQCNNGAWIKKIIDCATQKQLQNVQSVRPTVSIVSYDTANPTFELDYTNKKLIVNGVRLMVADSHALLYDSGLQQYQTDFIGDSVSAVRLSFVIHNVETNKLYLVDFAKMSLYPEFNSSGARANWHIGSIIRQYSGTWCFGFNFAHIKIDGVDYYGSELERAKAYAEAAMKTESNTRKSEIAIVQKRIDDTKKSPLSVASYDTNLPSFCLNTTDKKLSASSGRIIITDSAGIVLNKEIPAYETSFVGDNTSPAAQSFIVYNVETNKLYFVNYAKMSLYPEFNSSGARANWHIGSIIRQYSGTWCFGFNFAHIKIDGVDYYGNFNAHLPLGKSDVSFLPLSVEDVSFIRKVRTENLFDKNTAVHGYYGKDGVTFLASDVYWCSDYIPVEENVTYKTNKDIYFYLYLYDENKNVVLVGGAPYWAPNNEIFTIPAGVRYLKKIFAPSSLDSLMVTLATVDTSEYISYYAYELLPEIAIPNLPNVPQEDSILSITSDFGVSDVGNLKYHEIDTCDYAQVIMYGQSLSMGWESPEAITEDPIDGVYMVGDKVAIRHGNNGTNVLNPLVSTLATYCGENPTVGAINAFAPLYKRFVNKTQNFIATSCGEGGKTIEQLSKESTNGTNLYEVEFLNALNRTKASVDAENKTVGCFAILYMQGEYNYTNLQGAGLSPGTDATSDKDTYKAYLKTLKNNMQADIMSAYGQKEKPLFLIYEVAGYYINRFDMSINMAQVEFAQENDDVFLLPPTYPVPDYNGGHLSTNGYRWYGEMIAKTMYNVFVKGKRFYPIMPKKYTIDGKKLKIDFYVPVAPLVFDTWTKETISNFGFRVRVNNADVVISDVSAENTAVILTCVSDLIGKVEVSYAGQGRNGSGNLRDSDTWRSYYTYYDDTISSPNKRENYTPLDAPDGSEIYGKPYPMYNWCGNFYKLVQE